MYLYISLKGKVRGVGVVECDSCLTRQKVSEATHEWRMDWDSLLCGACQ